MKLLVLHSRLNLKFNDGRRSMEGILNLDKPAGLSSARAVARVKRLLPAGVKAGHAGTLDPFATGVLLILIGRATRQCERLMDQPKIYHAIVRLGATTPTDDVDSAETFIAGTEPPAREAIEAAAQSFTGTILQKPPAFSALKVAGRRAYALARAGRPADLPPRPVQIYQIDLLDYEWPAATLRVRCGRGTYIRSLARDLGAALGVGGYLAALRRTAVGNFDDSSAVPLDQLSNQNVSGHVLHADAIAPYNSTLTD